MSAQMNSQTERDLFSWDQIQDDRSFWQYHQDNPHVYQYFKEFSLHMIKNRGYKRLSSDMILHRVRYEIMDSRFKEQLKINNNYTAGYSRLFMKEFPQYSDVFSLRQLKSNTNKDI